MENNIPKLIINTIILKNYIENQTKYYCDKYDSLPPLKNVLLSV